MHPLLLLLTVLAGLQDPEKEMEARDCRGADGGRLPYRLYRPVDVVGGGKRPLLLFLHGAGERGDDNRKQLKNCIRNLLPIMEKNACFLVAPQCPNGRRWVEVDWSAPRHDTPAQPSEPLRLAIELLEALRKDLPVDDRRIYVSGLSMGGYGTWDLIVRRPDLFAAAIPVCGGGDEKRAAEIARIPQWIFHGDRDNVVPTARSRNMVEALRKAGGNPRYTEYAGVGHNCWDRAYAEPGLFPWLFAQKRP